MNITLDSKLEARLRERASVRGLSIESYVERLLSADQAADDELQELALDGINSGEPVEVGPGYWEEKHRLLDSRLKMTGIR
jgi:hypothetical protein